MFARPMLAAATVIAAATMSALAVFAGGQQPSLSTDDFRPIRLLPPQPAIKEPPVMAAEEADRLIVPKELVLGVVIDGKPRAYPINMLTGPQREIINDSVGGAAIAATW